jgi:hypothetical protein
MQEEYTKYQVIIDTAIVQLPVFEGNLTQCQKEFKKWRSSVKKKKWILVENDMAEIQTSHIISVRIYRLPIESVVATNMLKNPLNQMFTENADLLQSKVLDGGYK